jgi:hypothetical protein
MSESEPEKGFRFLAVNWQRSLIDVAYVGTATLSVLLISDRFGAYNAAQLAQDASPQFQRRASSRLKLFNSKL